MPPSPTDQVKQRNNYQWRMFIGPKMRDHNHAHFYNWTLIGATADNFGPTTTLVGAFSNTATDFEVVDHDIFDAVGGLFIGNENGGNFEYVDYQTKEIRSGTQEWIDDLIRERAQSHDAGELVRQWYLVESDDGSLNWSRTMTDNGELKTWEVDVSGYLANLIAIRNGHLCLVQYREFNYTTSLYTSWSTLLLGVLTDPRISDDQRRVAQWSIKIKPIPEVHWQEKTKGIRVGTFDVAQNSSASSIATLGAAWKEASSGDYLAANPDFSAGAAINPDGDHVWIADRFLGGANATNSGPGNAVYAGDSQWDDEVITQIFLGRPGQVEGYRWLEITHDQTIDIGTMKFRGAVNDDQTMVLGTATSIPRGGKLIVCENQELFEREWPGHGADAIWVVEDRDSGPNIFDQLVIAGDGLSFGSNAANTNNSVVVWGTMTWATASATTGWQAWGSLKTWTGSAIAAPATGEVMRYIYQPSSPTNSEDYWSVDEIATPGYDLPGYRDLDSNLEPVPWIKIDLPKLGLKLTNAITAISPAATEELYISDLSDASTIGLSPTGTIQVGTERISYTAKSETSITVGARGADSTTAAAHAADDKVSFVQNSLETDSLPIDEIVLYEASSGIHPDTVECYVTNSDVARDPTQDNWKNDYHKITGLSDWTSGSTYTISVPASNNRVVSAVIRPIDMRDGTGVIVARPRLKRVEIKVLRSDYDTDHWPATQTTNTVFTELNTRAKLLGGILTFGSGLPDISDRITASRTVRNVLLDLAQKHLLTVTINADSTIDVDNNGFWTTASHTDTQVWSEQNALQIDLSNTYGSAISQVKLYWKTDDDSDGGVVAFPATAADLGEPIEVGTDAAFVTANSSEASIVAENMYRQLSSPHSATLLCEQNFLTMEPGEIHRIDWIIDPRYGVWKRKYLVLGVDQQFEWDNKSRLIELSTSLSNMVMIDDLPAP